MATKPNPFNKRMRAAREAKGLSLVDVTFELRQLMPKPMWVGPTTISRLETSVEESKADPFLVNVLASIYGKRTSDLSGEAAEHLDTMRGLLEHALPCTTARRSAASR